MNGTALTAALTLSLSSSYHWYDSNWLYGATRFTESRDIVIYWWFGLVLLIPKLISKLIDNRKLPLDESGWYRQGNQASYRD
jgi:hypothetical protein